ncbi:hypothetical protein VKT23_007828 [Stygiomarasmius scandens]|uniref:Protein kinase domain-containing protein n=1 Tax=Marasmiellus scandens TaxID=2682957 RepID=A0ABR1JL77_9AGAR
MINCLDTANPPKVAEAIAKDEPQVEKLLIKVLNSDSERKAALSLRGHDAELFMDVLQNFELDHHTDRPDLAKDARKLLVSLSKLSTNLPETMFISGVEPVKERNVHGGTFGDVYRSFFEGRPVALKRLRIFQRSDESEKKALYKRFCREALIWQTLRHEFVLPFLGIDAENFPRQPCMVSPWMSNGTLNHFLKKNPKANIDKLLFEIAQGIDYLHSQSIVHGDIKGVNILIDEYWKPHLADFGLTLFADATRQNTTDMGGTLRWMAPELFDESAPCRRTSASDIYAYGCLCIEAYTGKPPYQEIRGELQVIGLVKSGIRPSRPTGSSTMTDGLWELVNACWHQDSSSRLKSNMVVEGLRTILRQSAIDNSQHSTSPLLNAHSSASLGSGRRLSSYSNPAEEVVKRNIMSSQDQAEFARCLKRIRHHADPGRMYRDIKILRYNSSIKFSEAAIRGTNSKVTIKQFRTSSQDVKTLRRLVDEFHDMRYLHHANLINYIDLFQHESDIWVVLEGIHKTISLKKVISANVSRDAGLKESFIATVLRNVGQALHYLHRHAINHGNINSEEILLSYIGKSILVRLKLGAMLEDTDITRTSICPPEIVDSGEEGRSAAADVWSLGVLAIEMFDSTVDISLPSSVLLEHMRNSNPRPSALMLDFLEQILQIDPRKRPVIASLLQNSFLQK